MERLPVEVVIEGERIVLGSIQIIESLSAPGQLDSSEVILDFGTRRFRGTIAGPPWNVFALKEELF